MASPENAYLFTHFRVKECGLGAYVEMGSIAIDANL